MPMIPYAPELPEGLAFSATQEGRDFLPQITAALKRYGHLALEICTTGKPDQPPGMDPFPGNIQYGITQTILVPRSGTFMGRMSNITMLPWFTPLNGVALGMWPTWSAGAQQPNSQRIEGIAIAGLGSDNAAVFSVGMTADQCNRMFTHDLHMWHQRIGYNILNPQYGHLEFIHSSFCAIGMVIAVFGPPQAAGGGLDIERWGLYYDWGPTDNGSNCNGIGLVHVRGGGSQYSPFLLKGAYLRDKAQAIAIIRDPSNPDTPGYGVCLRIENGSTEYQWGGQGGEDEIVDTYSNGQRLYDGSAQVPLAVLVGPAVMPLASPATLPAPGFVQGQVSSVNGAPIQYNNYDIPLWPGDVVEGANLQLLTHASGTVYPITTRAGLIYIDRNRGLYLPKYSFNNNFAALLCQAEDGGVLNLGEVAFGGRATFGFRARGPNARVNFDDILPSGYVRTHWENIGRRPQHFSGGIEALNTHQRSVMLAMMGNGPVTGGTNPVAMTTNVCADAARKTLTWKKGASPTADHARWPAISVAAGIWNLASIWLKAAETVRVMAHVRTTDGISWVAGSSPGHNADPISLPIGPTGTTIYNPFGYDGSGYPGPTYFGWDNTNCGITFTDFTGLTVTSTNPGPIGPPPIMGGGNPASGPFLLGDNGGQESSILPPDNKLVYHYTSAGPGASIVARCANPEALTLWAGLWQEIAVLWPAETNVSFALSLAATPDHDIALEYGGYFSQGSPIGGILLPPTVIVREANVITRP